MQYGLLRKNVKHSPLAQLWNKIPVHTVGLRKKGFRWKSCKPSKAQHCFEIASSTFHTQRYLMYCIIISEEKPILRQVGSFSRAETARLALNRGILYCSAFKRQQSKAEANTHVICPIHSTDTCHFELTNNIEPSREQKNGIEREYFLVHEGSLEFAAVPWWK